MGSSMGNKKGFQKVPLAAWNAFFPDPPEAGIVEEGQPELIAPVAGTGQAC